jgi:hypothetical protein
MNKRVFLLVASALFVACFGLVAVTAQAPTPTPQVAPAPPAPPALQKPTPPPAPPAPPAPQRPTPPPAPAAPPVPSQPPRPEAANVRVDVTITDQGNVKGSAVIKTMSIVCSRNGSVRSGVNVPQPSTTFGAAGSGGVNTIPITSYNYRTMGLSLDVGNLYVTGNTIHARISVEYNPVDEAEKADRYATTAVPAPYSNFSQTFELDLENGKPLIVAQSSDPVPSHDRRLSVEVKATILK